MGKSNFGNINLPNPGPAQAPHPAHAPIQANPDHGSQLPRHRPNRVGAHHQFTALHRASEVQLAKQAQREGSGTNPSRAEVFVSRSGRPPTSSTARTETSKNTAPQDEGTERVRCPVGIQIDSSRTPAPITGPALQRQPITKILAYVSNSDFRADGEYAQQIFSKRIKGVDPDSIRFRHSAFVGEEFEWFFSPDDIMPGDMHILLVTGHAKIKEGIVILELKDSNGRRVDTTKLLRAINKLPAHCNLEVIMSVCHAEGTIPGLHQVWVMNYPSPTTAPQPNPRTNEACGPASGPPPHISHSLSITSPLASRVAPPTPGILDHLPQLFGNHSKVKSKANIVFWAAALKDSPAFPVAICRALESEGPNVTRRNICEMIRKEATKQNDARAKRDKKKTAKKLEELGPRVQIPALLSSSSDFDRVLDSFIFQPLPPGSDVTMPGGYPNVNM